MRGAGQARHLEPDRDLRGRPAASTPEEVEREFEGQGYGAFKQAVGEAVVELLAPVRERYGELRADEDALEPALRQGAERAREIAVPTMAEVRAVMGVGRSVRQSRPSGAALKK